MDNEPKLEQEKEILVVNGDNATFNCVINMPQILSLCANGFDVCLKWIVNRRFWW